MSTFAYPIEPDLITVEHLNECSYTDFVGIINQWNVPPGSYDTLSRWQVFGGVGSESRVLEIASTTGFSSREIARSTGCTAEGIDISEMSIRLAQYNGERYGDGARVEYRCEDGLELSDDRTYTHIVIGAAAKFFPDPVKLVLKCTELLEDGGKLLASPFYVEGQIPEELIERARGVFGITVTNEPYAEVFQPYAGLDVLYEEHFAPRQETDAELAHYCDSTIQRFSRDAGVTDADVLDAARARLLDIKRVANDLRPYQRWATLVLGYRESQYPHRYVELF
ncbi:class I SAM-dependent methyltransferase [Streptomyces venezuelae]|uniref:class I SAM-dependent methyltransferase n=1 Tax=Streptomyces venezuelae TaxID=54571 RepID=UPI003654A747